MNKVHCSEEETGIWLTEEQKHPQNIMWGPQEEKNSVQGKRRKKANVKQAHCL